MNFTNKNLYFFNKAKQISTLSSYPRIHIGAVIVQNGRIIASGFNTTKSHPLQAKYNKYRHFTDGKCNCTGLHAETSAVISAINFGYDLHGAEIYVYRQNSLGQIGQCRPCAACGKLLIDCGIVDWYYVNEFGNFVYERITND